ncbi:DUF2855 family protein [Streptomyces jumonjinensis]|uniref:DUF2855 family protein n=1 Tax=Streptomyces jumonjinensis TaxID=1945 RepID=A0A646KQU3_STRJU|nr:DUF2855 family protein [Streptomyces jumonjinensis]MQT04694.1 DUF2855 family protein [Streptomyces jumonjinensis]
MPELERWELLVRRDDLTQREIRPIPGDTLRPGQIRLAVENFAVTAISATYMRLGDSELPFWDAFPGPEGYGRVPAWGHARVEESNHPGIAVGDRCYGLLPMATHVTLTVDPTERGFTETSPAREFLHPWYRTYLRTGEADLADDHATLLRPLFSASFNVAHCLTHRTDAPPAGEFLVRRDGPAPRSVLITSASSKTAIGLAGLLAPRRDLTVTGVTSARNTAFVRSLGLYDTVVAYDDLTPARIEAPTVLVDFTGVADRLFEVAAYAADSLTQILLVGYTHPGAQIDPPPELIDPMPEIFFTPPEEDQLIAAEGEQNYLTRYTAAERRFIREAASWLSVRRAKGPEALLDAVDRLLTGGLPVDTGTVVSPS